MVETALDGATPLPTPEFPHQAATNEPTGFCPVNAPGTPDWPPAPPSEIPDDFTIGLPAKVSVTVSPDVSDSVPVVPIDAEPSLYPLTQQTYTLSATASSCTPPTGQYCSCQQNFTVTSTGWTSSGSNCCQLGGGGSTTTIGVAAAPYLCQGP